MSAPIKEISTSNGEIGVRLLDIDVHPDRKTVVVERFFPSSRNEAEAIIIDLNHYERSGRSQDDQDFLDNIDDLDYGYPFHSPLAKKLGYSHQVRRSETEGITTTKIVFTYPTVSCLNNALDRAFPGRDSLRFVEFQGGNYRRLDFMKSLILDGEVMVSQDQTYEVHDHHALHVLGWSLAGGKFGTFARETLYPFLNHLDTGSPLPEEPAVEDLQSLMEALMSKWDVFSYAVAARVLGEKKGDNNLLEKIQEAFSAGRRAYRIREDKIVRVNNLRSPDSNQAAEMLEDIHTRYAILASI